MTRPFRLIHSQAPLKAEPAVLAARNLSKVYKGESGFYRVLDSVDFEVQHGEFVCLIGPSGCGKSTLLNLIAGFLPPSSGTIEINGRSVTRAGPDRCVIFQEDALFPWMTVAENIAFGLKGSVPKQKLAEQVQRYLEMVDLSAFKHYLPREISGGMKQRVALARVLILKPKVLLMDEPFGALDAQTREHMQRLLLALWAELSHTILFVTHDLGEAVTLADRILIMDGRRGRIKTDIPVTLERPRRKESDAYHRFFRDLHQRI